MYCRHCNGSMIGNGFNSVVHCEHAHEADYQYHEADANPVYCRQSITYTGIGSRETPVDILQEMTKLAYEYADQGHTLRSGKAGGADAAFQSGVEWYCYNNNIQYHDFKGAEIYVPWRGFGDKLRSEWDKVGVHADTLDLAARLHPAWDKCSQGAKKLHARNTCQILGGSLDKPSDLVLFYAPECNGIVKGGTATAVKLARDKGITTINMANVDWREQLHLFWALRTSA